jgi:uncharacterized OB-fold protein
VPSQNQDGVETDRALRVAPGRALPALTAENRHFWLGGADGELVMLKCRPCGYRIHPPGPICPICHSADVAPAPTSGSGFVYSFTINHQQWIPGWETPYVIAIVELDDQVGLRVTTNIGGPIDLVAIGMRVVVRFEQIEDVFLPFFVPVRQP